MCEERCCGTCRWHDRDEEYSDEFTCDNEDSEYYADYTDYGDICDCYEER